jgi:hypothetical protein
MAGDENAIIAPNFEIVCLLLSSHDEKKGSSHNKRSAVVPASKIFDRINTIVTIVLAYQANC